MTTSNRFKNFTNSRAARELEDNWILQVALWILFLGDVQLFSNHRSVRQTGVIACLAYDLANSKEYEPRFCD
jgi:hypothetical protein